VFYTLAVV